MGYLSFVDNEHDSLNMNSRFSDDMPLMVNCAGTIDLYDPFTTYNASGRLDYYLMYIADGKLTVDINGEEKIASSGDIIIFAPRYKYKYTHSKGRIVYYFVHFTGSHTDRFFERLGFGEFPAVKRVGQSEEISGGFSEIFDAYIRDGAFRDMELSYALEGLLVALAKALVPKESSARPLSRSLSYIKTSYTDDISVRDLAAMESVSVSRYNVLFKETVGVSPIRYVTALRMNKARALLEATDLPIKKIGEIVGYADNHFFSKAFKKHTGICASEYRSKMERIAVRDSLEE